MLPSDWLITLRLGLWVDVQQVLQRQRTRFFFLSWYKRMAVGEERSPEHERLLQSSVPGQLTPDESLPAAFLQNRMWLTCLRIASQKPLKTGKINHSQLNRLETSCTVLVFSIPLVVAWGGGEFNAASPTCGTCSRTETNTVEADVVYHWTG